MSCFSTSPPALHVLLTLHKHYPQIFRPRRIPSTSLFGRTTWQPAPEIYVDGGIRRGTDVVKALCLGARAVGMGRPFVYALGWGWEGVEKAVESEFFCSARFLFMPKFLN